MFPQENISHNIEENKPPVHAIPWTHLKDGSQTEKRIYNVIPLEIQTKLIYGDRNKKVASWGRWQGDSPESNPKELSGVLRNVCCLFPDGIYTGLYNYQTHQTEHLKSLLLYVYYT